MFMRFFVLLSSIVCGLVAHNLFISGVAPWPVYLVGLVIWIAVFINDKIISGELIKHYIPNDELADISLGSSASKTVKLKKRNRLVIAGFVLGILLGIFLPQDLPIIGVDSDINGHSSVQTAQEVEQ